ncbi:MAG: RIP metalloprotease RseP [Lachnospiraceae bacterium]|nr:RIP metalloprotease RseP [Lachnospiraceae bacterium]
MKIVIAILIFGLIVLIHELGHFIFARINGIEVLDFSIGMGPRLCGFRAFGTQFSVRLLPIGGACMMLGENEDQNMNNERSFYAKNVWQRISVLFAGPGFNFILAFIFSVIIIGIAGYDPARIIKVAVDGPAAEAGLSEGDVITRINHSSISVGREVQGYFDYHTLSEEPVDITVKRNGEKIKVSLVPEQYDRYLLGFTYSGNEAGTAEIIEVSKGYPMAAAGISAGDVITKINDTEVRTGGELSAYLDRNPLDGKAVEITYKRDGVEHTLSVTPQYETTGYSLGFAYNLAREDANAWETIKYSVSEVKYWIVETARGLGKLVTGRLKSNEIGSAVAIVDAIGETYEASVEYGVKDTVLNMLYITVLLSANLGVMNLLPIPALDGGKLLFCAIEVIRGKPIDREKEGMVHFIGMVVLMILMVFLLFNDVKNVFFSK